MSLPLLIAGFDAACWEYIVPWLQEGALPNLARLLQQGRPGILRSTMPALTPVAWATLATGYNPGRHGVFEWNRLTHDAGGAPRLRLHTSHTLQGTPFWRRLDTHGLRVGLINIPLTFPPQPLDGCVLCGYPLHDPQRRYLYPPDLLPALEAEFGPYEPGHLEGMLAEGADWYAADLRAQEFQVAAAIRLTNQLQLHVLAINLMLPDHANHLARDMHGVRQAYIDSDRHLGQLLAALQPHNLILLSDHGSRRIQGKFYINQWLHEQGLLTWTPRPAADPAGDLNWLLLQALRDRHLPAPLEKITRNALRRLLPQRNGALSPWAARLLARLAPAAYRAYAFDSQPDWARSRFFSFGSLIYETAAGQPPGSSPTAADLRARLLALRDPAGKPVFRDVIPSADIFHGPQLSEAPALILDTFSPTLDWSLAFAPNYRTDGAFLRSDDSGFNWRGEHSRDGIFVFHGPAFAATDSTSASTSLDPTNLVNLPVADLASIPATVLHLCGIPIPPDYDGRVLHEFLAPTAPLIRAPVPSPLPDLAPPPSDPGAPISPAEEALIAEQLRALGYVD